MKNELLTKGIILPSGEIGKNKINLVAGAITQPFAEMVWVTTGGDMETINRLTNTTPQSKSAACGRRHTRGIMILPYSHSPSVRSVAGNG